MSTGSGDRVAVHVSQHVLELIGVAVAELTEDERASLREGTLRGLVGALVSPGVDAKPCGHNPVNRRPRSVLEALLVVLPVSIAWLPTAARAVPMLDQGNIRRKPQA